MDNNACPNCGKSLPSNAAFCGNCGTKVSRQIPIVTAQTTPKYPPQFYELDQLLPVPGRKPTNKQIQPGELRRILTDFEKGRGEVYARASRLLHENLPLAAVQPLWSMKSKLFFPEEKTKDVMSLLSEIGGDEVVKLITDEAYVASNLLDYLQVLALTNSPKSIPWLAKNSSDHSLTSIMAMKILERFNNPEVIPNLVKHASFLYIESEPANSAGYKGVRKSSGLLPGVIAAGIKAVADSAANHETKMNFARLIPAPFMPIQQLESDTTNFAWRFLTEKFRFKTVLSLVEKFGLRYLEDCWKDVNPQTDESITTFLSACYLYKGLQHPFIRQTIDSLINLEMTSSWNHSRLIFLMDAIITSKNESIKSQYTSVIGGLLNHKEPIITAFINSSILYNNFSPLISQVLAKGLVSEYIPAIVFSSEEFRNPTAKALLSGARDPSIIQEIEESKRVLSSWKV